MRGREDRESTDLAGAAHFAREAAWPYDPRDEGFDPSDYIDPPGDPEREALDEAVDDGRYDTEGDQP